MTNQPFQEEYERGYSEQDSWLQGLPIETARIALAAREATEEPTPYNLGATQATRDYIARGAES